VFINNVPWLEDKDKKKEKRSMNARILIQILENEIPKIFDYLKFVKNYYGKQQKRQGNNLVKTDWRLWSRTGFHTTDHHRMKLTYKVKTNLEIV
jgi:hypothetical protein